MYLITTAFANIAANKTAYQSSNVDNYTVNFGVDDNASTMAVTLSTFDPSWWLVDLVETYQTVEINLLAGTIVQSDLTFLYIYFYYLYNIYIII